MTWKQAIIHAGEILATNGIEDSPLEAEILLRHVLQISRVQLYQDINCELSPESESLYSQVIERRLKGEPTAYITGHREFYGLDFYVDRRVLIPRPESELLVDEALKCARRDPFFTIADIGTGCGAIAVNLALNLPGARIYATDVSAEALEVAKVNCRKHGVADRVRLLHGDLLTPLPEPVNIIVANLPYVKKAELPGVTTSGYEPELALDGGASGLETIFRLCRQAEARLKPAGCLLLEIGMGQGKAVANFLRGLFPSGKIDIIPDLSGIERVVRLVLGRK